MRSSWVLALLVALPSVALAQSDNEKMAAEVEAACQAQKGIIKDIMASASGVFELRPTLIQQGAGVQVTLDRTGTWEHKE